MNNILPLPAKKYKVDVLCMSYNQSMYILDTLNGFTMQQTDFPFVCLIFDDASTDGEPEIIRKYVEENFDMPNAIISDNEIAYNITAVHKKNTNCTFVVFLLKENHYQKAKPRLPYYQPWRDYCQYEAMCEGDDYWFDPNKLQMQVNCMDSNKNTSMSFHAVRYLYPNDTTKDIHRYAYNNPNCDIVDMIRIGGDYAKVNSIVYRISSIGKGYSEWTKNCPVGDLPMQLTLFAKGKVVYINDVMSCYRISADSSWSKSQENNSSKRKDLQRRIEQMWKDFDSWTKGEFHSDVVKKIRRNKYLYIRSSIIYAIKRFAKKR